MARVLFADSEAFRREGQKAYEPHTTGTAQGGLDKWMGMLKAGETIAQSPLAVAAANAIRSGVRSANAPGAEVDPNNPNAIPQQGAPSQGSDLTSNYDRNMAGTGDRMPGSVSPQEVSQMKAAGPGDLGVDYNRAELVGHKKLLAAHDRLTKAQTPDEVHNAIAGLHKHWAEYGHPGEADTKQASPEDMVAFSQARNARDYAAQGAQAQGGRAPWDNGATGEDADTQRLRLEAARHMALPWQSRAAVEEQALSRPEATSPPASPLAAPVEAAGQTSLATPASLRQQAADRLAGVLAPKAEAPALSADEARKENARKVLAGLADADDDKVQKSYEETLRKANNGSEGARKLLPYLSKMVKERGIDLEVPTDEFEAQVKKMGSNVSPDQLLALARQATTGKKQAQVIAMIDDADIPYESLTDIISGGHKRNFAKDLIKAFPAASKKTTEEVLAEIALKQAQAAKAGAEAKAVPEKVEVAREGNVIKGASAGERVGHNAVTESQGESKITGETPQGKPTEQKRSHQENERLKQDEIDGLLGDTKTPTERGRHARTAETETERHNRAVERAAWGRINKMGAGGNKDAATAHWAETVAVNRKREADALGREQAKAKSALDKAQQDLKAAEAAQGSAKKPTGLGQFNNQAQAAYGKLAPDTAKARARHEEAKKAYEAEWGDKASKAEALKAARDKAETARKTADSLATKVLPVVEVDDVLK